MQNKRLKILRIIAQLGIGGSVLHTIILTAELDKTRFDSILVAGVPSSDQGDMTSLASDYGINPIIIPELRTEINWKNDLIALYKLIKIIRKEKPDIVDTQTAKAGTLGRISAVISGVPCIVHTFHGHVLYGYFGKIKTLAFMWIERILARFTSKIVVISQLQFGDLCHKYRLAPQNKFAVIPLGFDLSEFYNGEQYSGKLRNELGIAEDTMIIGTVGRLVSVKNIELFLKVADKVLRQNDNVRFIIVGDGLLAPSLKKLAKELGINEKVFFLGWRNDMPAIYADIDIFALTSLNEGTPVTLIEAMASGKAVVSTAVGGVPDVIMDGETGILVQSGDEEGLAKAIIELISDPEKRRNFGSHGQKIAVAKYTKERLIEDISKLYEELVHNATKARKP